MSRLPQKISSLPLWSPFKAPSIQNLRAAGHGDGVPPSRPGRPLPAAQVEAVASGENGLRLPLHAVRNATGADRAIRTSPGDATAQAKSGPIGAAGGADRSWPRAPAVADSR